MEQIQQLMRNYWGYSSFLPLQKEAIECILTGRDSLVVLPTGGGKSLCFQAPALKTPGMAIVISPLISLMKDQVDALRECGIPAARLDSSQKVRERKAVFARLYEGDIKILYLSPEKLLSDSMVDFVHSMDVSFIAIDEAHCISMWGHDFRPEYRKLGTLKDIFPNITLHTYTATATPQVRNDIITQLRLSHPKILVGSFDRPNLIYSVQPRRTLLDQVTRVIGRHEGESGIIYCIRRADVEQLCAQLVARGHPALPYHAGMSDTDRKDNQEQFIRENTDIIVATIAFGMGIDKPNVRYVIHTGMPKSLEHYQQESGRAGRDGLEAECLLLYSGGDYGIWKSIFKDQYPGFKMVSMRKLGQMYRYCTGVKCRHRTILRYFGQDLENENCGACDVCLGEVEYMDDALVPAQKILSCVVRLGERFGADYTSLVLIGSGEKRIKLNGHDRLSTYGLLSDYSRGNVREWIEQLVTQQYIRKAGEYHTLAVTQKGWRVLKGEETPRLIKYPRKREKKKREPSKIAQTVDKSWDGVDKGLFEELRRIRTVIANQKGVPAYVVFPDAALRDMARRKPSTIKKFHSVKGVGEKKCKKYGPTFLTVIKDYCETHDAPVDET